jgi:hypothetical protein
MGALPVVFDLHDELRQVGQPMCRAPLGGAAIAEVWQQRGREAPYLRKKQKGV